jgi:hypothetical protein
MRGHAAHSASQTRVNALVAHPTGIVTRSGRQQQLLRSLRPRPGRAHGACAAKPQHYSEQFKSAQGLCLHACGRLTP